MSYSEYLNRMKQRLPTYIDTRPHRDAGHHTEVIKRRAASQTQETKVPNPAGVLVLNGPSTRVTSYYAKAHTVQDTSVYNAYTAGQAVAQTEKVLKPSQIQAVCYSSTVVPEYNDKLKIYPQLAAVQAARNALNGCCKTCGKPPVFENGCNCRLTVAQQVGLPTSYSRPTLPS